MNNKLSTVNAAKRLGVSASTLRKWRLSGYGPRYYKITANRAVYDIADLDAWLSDRSFMSTTEETARLG